jgi:hypothetical protein
MEGGDVGRWMERRAEVSDGDGASDRRAPLLWCPIARPCLLLRAAAGALQEPTGNPQRGDPECSAPGPARQSGLTGIGGQQLPVGFGVGRRRVGFRSRSLPAFGHGNPAADIGERLRAADGAFERVVDFLAVEAEAGYTKLHGEKCTPAAAMG